MPTSRAHGPALNRSAALGFAKPTSLPTFPGVSFDSRILAGLHILTAVAEAGSFVRAGEVLGLTQSAVSRAVQRLEQQLKVRLFDRTSRAVTLTDEGRHFLQSIRPLLGQMEQAIESAGAGAASVRGRLRVNVDAHFARLTLAPHIGQFLARHPHLSLELEVRDQLGELVAEGFDVAVRFGHPDDSSLIVRKLLDVRVATCAAPAYLEIHGTPRTPRDLERGAHEFILFRDPANRLPFPWEFHQGRKVARIKTPGRLTVNDGMSMIASCVSGYGLAQMFDWGLDELIVSRQLVKVLPNWSDETWPLYAYYVSREHMPLKTRGFLDFVVSLVGHVK